MKNKAKKSWTATVQKVYHSMEELEHYDSIYNIAQRCGYDKGDIESLWFDNPKIGGGTNPADFGLAE